MLVGRVLTKTWTYRTQHFFLLFLRFSSLKSSGRSESWNFRTIRTSSWKAWSTLILTANGINLHEVGADRDEVGGVTDLLRCTRDKEFSAVDWVLGLSLWQPRVSMEEALINHSVKWCKPTHHSLGFQVGLVADHQHRKLVSILDPENLPVELENFFEAGIICHTEH